MTRPVVNAHSSAQLVVAVATGILAGLAIATVGGEAAPWAAAVTLLLAGTLLVRVPVPWGGSVPLGYALVGALPALDAWAPLTVAVAVAVVVAVTGLRQGTPAGKAIAARLVPPCAAAVAAGGVLEAVDGGSHILVQVLVTCVALFVVDALVTRRVPVDGQRLELQPALPVYLTLACGAALIAVATDGFGVVMATVAAFPLLITRFSFQRYAEARETLRQTVQALGLVPELAGLAPLGHSERTAHYAGAMAEEMGFGRAAVERIVTASRLHHLGAVPFDPADPDHPEEDREPDHEEVASSGALILRDAKFPSDVADLLQAACAGSRDEPPSLEAAVVRVATAFDDAVGEDESKAGSSLWLVGSTAFGPHSRRAVASLYELAASCPTLVSDAVTAGARFKEAASGLDLEELMVGSAGGEILPFARRRA